MLARLEQMSNQLPPRLKALLNLAITVVLLLLSIPFLWGGLDVFSGGGSRAWTDASLGLGLFLLGVFNLFT
ncbi:MAG TPA: hypothetical protein VHH36_06620 [Candidatus Thermoplasmatota archaeon]|nr:hypothetical protein [Candidatus Thermoplasmatota archaeon]